MIRIGIISPSEIAFRRFLPALDKVNGTIFVGVAVASEKDWTGLNYNISIELEKARPFIENYGGKIFKSYGDLIDSNEVDAVYIPLPPALHYRWAKHTLSRGKHVMIEKPATISLIECDKLVLLANEKKLAIHENYMFVFHDQIQKINEHLSDGDIGEVRLYRISFGFPLRKQNDFRYNKELGGGAILDCGGYTLKYASMLLGESTRVICAQINGIDGFEVEMYGSASLINSKGITAQVAFGMDNSYKCEIEVWGSKGILFTNRVLTAPVDYEPELTITKENNKELFKLKKDDAFMKSIQHFVDCIINVKDRKNNYKTLIKQASILEQFNLLSKKK